MSRRPVVLALLAVCLVCLYAALFRVARIPDSSMRPTYDEGEFVLLRRRIWPFEGVKDGDVVMVRTAQGEYHTARVDRVGGEEIDLHTLAGQGAARRQLNDRYEKRVVTTTTGPDVRYVVPDGYVTVLEDNRGSDWDSRSVGPVPIEEIVATVVNGRPYLPPLRPLG